MGVNKEEYNNRTHTYYERHDTAIRTLYHNLDTLLEQGILQNKTVVMFGTSNLASIVIYYLKQKGIQVQAIIDNDSSREGKIVYGVPVFLPEQYMSKEAYSQDKIVLIASTYQKEMRAQLEQMGYEYHKNIFYAIDLPQVMNDYSYVDRTSYVELTDDEIKQVQLGILQKLDTVCKEHGIRYYICGGTLIGAVRHQGYIPWDDDIDVVMPLGDIIRLEEVLRNDEDYSFIGMSPDMEYFDACSLMVDNRTVCDFNGFLQLTSGVSIDIFPFIGVPQGQEEFDAYIKQMRTLEMKKWNLMYDMKACMQAYQEQIQYMMTFDYDTYDTIGNVLGRYFLKDIFPRYYFEETVELPFEHLRLAAPKHYHEYLTRLYGDYMKLPPKEKQVGVHYYRAYWRKEQ